MNIIFEYEDKRITLPVNPEEVSVNIPSASQKVNVIGVGQISIPQDPDLGQINIKSFFWKYLFDTNILRLAESYLPASSLTSKALSGISSVDTQLKNITGSNLIDDSKKFKLLNEYVKWFKEWQSSKKPARWTIVVPPNEPAQCFDFDVTCEKFTYKIVAGEETDYYYEMELVEYRHYGAEEVETKQVNGKVVATKKSNVRLSNKSQLAPKLTVKPSDTLWSIAQKNSTGELESWKTLYNVAENKAIIANNLNNLTGQTLKMPKEWLNVY